MSCKVCVESMQEGVLANRSERERFHEWTVEADVGWEGGQSGGSEGVRERRQGGMGRAVG